MARWADFERSEAELASRARGFLELRTHLTLATLRRDGSPRISGTEIVIAEGDVWLGSMPRSMKALDLRRDPRYALHSGSVDPPEWEGDAKLAGRVEEVDDPDAVARVYAGSHEPPTPDAFHLFRCGVERVGVVSLSPGRDKLVVESWTPESGIRRIER